MTILKYSCALLLFYSFHIGIVAAEGKEDAVRVKAFTLKDQYKKRHEHTFPKERISIFALADRKGSDQLEGWIKPFYTHYEGKVEICGVANLAGVPGLLQPMIRRLFRSGVDYPVMMDWTGDVCTAFAYRPGEADIFIVNPVGTVVLRVSGKASAEKLNRCYEVINDLIKEGEASASTEGKDGSPKEEAPPPPASIAGKPRQES